MIRMRHRSLALFAALAAAVPALPAFADAAAGQKALMEAVPSDAWAVLMIPSLKGFDAKLAMLGKQLQVPIPPIVASAQSFLGLGEELDVDGGVALVAVDVKNLGQNGMVIMLPSSNPDAMIKKLASAAAAAGGDEEGDEEGGDKKPAAKSPDAGGGDATKIAMFGQPCFAAKKGNFVVIGKTKDACIAVAKSKKSLASSIEKQRAAAFASADVVISAAASTWIKGFDEQIKNILQMASAVAGPGGGGAQLDQAVNNFSQLDSVDICLSISESGVGLIGMGTPKAGTDFAKALADRKPASQSLLARLPKDDFAFTMGGVAGAKTDASDKEIEQGVNQVLGMLQAKEKVDAEKLKSLIKEANALSNQFGDSAFSLSVLQGADGIIGAALVLQCKDPSDVMTRLGKLVTQLKGLSDEEEFKKAMTALDHKVGADEIGGSKIDTLAFDLAKLGDAVQPEDTESIKKVLGKDGLTLRFGPVGKDHIVLGIGGGKARFEKVVDAAKSDNGGLSSDASIQRVQKHLPAKKTGEFYLAVDALADGMQRIMTALDEGDSMPFKLGKVNAPVAGATSVDASSGRLDVFVPMELITAVKDASLAAQAGDDEEDADEGGKGDAKKPADKGHDGAKKPAKSDDDE